MLRGGFGLETVAEESASYGGKKPGSKKGCSDEVGSILWVWRGVCMEIGECVLSTSTLPHMVK